MFSIKTNFFFSSFCKVDRFLSGHRQESVTFSLGTHGVSSSHLFMVVFKGTRTFQFFPTTSCEGLGVESLCKAFQIEILCQKNS